MKFLLLCLTLFSAPAFACGADSDCKVGNRSYRIFVPDGVDTPMGAVIWAHGYRGSASGVMRNGSLRRMLAREGFALISAEAAGGGWDIPNGPRNMESTGAAEFAYFDAVVADAVNRFDLDRSRLVVSGFSAGGMLVWNLACARPDLFAGFVPISGTFWRAPPVTCKAPAKSLVHIHGEADRTVPLSGRAIGSTRQGDVLQALEMYRAHGKFGTMRNLRRGDLRCENRRNVTGEILDFCLFDGGHSIRTEYLRHALNRLKTAGRL